MRYRVYLLNNSPVEFDAVDFRVVGQCRIKCYLSSDDSYAGSEKSIDLYMPSTITQICDDHGRKVYVQ
jgi:hypothetical protein